VNRQTKQIGVVFCLVAMAAFGLWPFWKWLSIRAVNPRLYERTKMLVEKNPQLQPAWAIAMQDGVLTLPEAKVIVEAAGEKVEPQE
jgi:hypothetical protein